MSKIKKINIFYHFPQYESLRIVLSELANVSVPMSVMKILLCGWRLKFIHSQFPLPMALNSVLLKCQTERDLKFVYLLSDRHVPICNRNSCT